jgi:hypothetical protein
MTPIPVMRLITQEVPKGTIVKRLANLLIPYLYDSGMNAVYHRQPGRFWCFAVWPWWVWPYSHPSGVTRFAIFPTDAQKPILKQNINVRKW